MIPNFIPAEFKHDHRLGSQPQDQDLIFIFSANHLLLFENKQLPRWQDLKAALSDKIPELYCFGQMNNQSCFFLDWAEHKITQVPFTNPTILACRDLLSEAELRLAGLANQLRYWHSRHAFCGRCGTPTVDKSNERAKLCPQCQELYYPQLNPCIIVLVTRGRKMLLAHSSQFPHRFYSTLAGFIEAGESAEDAVHREVKEEVNLEIKNVRYVLSQPWPFPNSLMLGYLAEYESGEIKVDPVEIADAQWFDPEHLPELPPSLSISRFLIESHLGKS